MYRFDVVVIGGGGTGSEIAFGLAKRSNLRVALAERDRLGGECNHYGCVPTKVMLRAAKVTHLARRADRFGVRVPSVDVDLPAIQQRARDIVESRSGEDAAPFERVGVTVFPQEARLVGPRRVELADGTVLEADRVVLATGTEALIPPIPGLAEGPRWTNREAIWAPERPPTSLAVIGTGAIGIEFTQMFARFGTIVTAIETDAQVLPNEDPEAAAALIPALEEDGVTVRTGADVEGVDHDGSRWHVQLRGAGSFDAQELLVATGRAPVFDGHDLAAAGVELDDEGRPRLSPTLRTTAEGVWAAGDATGELLFTHVGTYEAELVVDDILGRPRERDYTIVPRVTFCDPEVASVGLTEPQARETGNDVVAVTAPIAQNERAVIDDAAHGLVKLVADGRTGSLLGGHVVAEGAGSMIHEIAAAMAGRVPARVVGQTIHAYPTLSETVKLAFGRLADRLDER